MAAGVGRARGQRREGGSASAVLNVELKSAVRFGEVTVPARVYRLTLGAESLAFADAETMVLVATVPAKITEAEAPAATPVVEVKKSGAQVEIVVKIGNQVARAVGSLSDDKAVTRAVTLDAKAEEKVSGSEPEVQTEQALVTTAIGRYLGGLKDCGDKAQRRRWGTDDLHFVKCVCPVLAKWRLPRIKKPVRIDTALVKGRSGFSFTATPEGKTSECRVWAGAGPPPPVSEGDAPAPAPALAPTPVAPQPPEIKP
ncbi:MAG: hypothetical protein HY903_07130 [Deltaproteobacteria bacterium]|nr:hypothetical protein [Deltaproteobacteria bacterium]